MSTNFFFKSLAVDNYRGLKKLKIDSLRRINIIGGLNGTGKSTLLEAVFLLLDRRNPIVLARPFMSRNLQMPFPNGLHYVFGSAGKTVPARISATVNNGVHVEARLEIGELPSTMNYSSPVGGTGENSLPGVLTTGNNDQVGLHLKFIVGGREEEASCTIQNSAEGLGFNQYRLGNGPVTAGAFTSSANRINPVEDAQRYSLLVKERRQKEIVDALKIINPELDSFLLLQEGNQPTLYATMKDGGMHLVSMLGGGFQSILSVVMLMMVTHNGVVLFDEVDSTIHFSKLKFFWCLISKLANQNNCQVLAVTHSRECISAAFTGLESVKKLADLQYIRLENDDNETDAITYTGEELGEALAGNWEIR
ncbi:AAA family ATPase [Herbaspirillum aquaticum]|uniref:AAA family ATPase n=1 Tax=Herbaspirillum aquaticum TaxID=568783 RepID=UPI0024DE1BC4|nr:AAA family ATPase [Herbaspirillum aquaticum]